MQGKNPPPSGNGRSCFMGSAQITKVCKIRNCPTSKYMRIDWLKAIGDKRQLIPLFMVGFCICQLLKESTIRHSYPMFGAKRTE